MIVVADASPIVFLDKLGRSGLILRLLGGPILVPRSVADELLAEPISPAEAHRLKEFLGGCRIVRTHAAGPRAGALSRADRDVLAVAIRHRAERILADDLLLRDLAEAEGIRPLGTLGVLVQALRRGFLSPGDAKADLDALVRDHGFRISVALYQAAVSRIQGSAAH
jgi:hypothetical protein